MDLYVGSENHLYEKTIYKSEDDLFESLNAIKERPGEIPEDKIITMVISAGVIILLITVTLPFYEFFFYGLSFSNLIALTYVPSIAGLQILCLMSLIFGLIVLAFFVMPYRQYRRRKLFRLL